LGLVENEIRQKKKKKRRMSSLPFKKSAAITTFGWGGGNQWPELSISVGKKGGVVGKDQQKKTSGC